MNLILDGKNVGFITSCCLGNEPLLLRKDLFLGGTKTRLKRVAEIEPSKNASHINFQFG